MKINSIENAAEIFKRFSENNPNPKIELYYTNEFTLMVAVVLSAQSTDFGVNKVTRKLFEVIKNPNDLLNLGEDNIINAIKTIGLYKTKAKNLIKISKILIDKFQGNVPLNFDCLVSFPGVGRKTANVILNTLNDEKVIAVDTHVLRLVKRLDLSDKKMQKDIEEDLMEIIPDKYLKNAALWIVLHGRYICKAKKPMCEKCFLSDICNYKNSS